MEFDILQQFGLHKNDTKVYEALCSLGISKTGAIIKATKISSSRVYESLRILIEKGLVSYFVKNNIKYYKAELPDQLVGEYKQKLDGLKALSHVIASLPQARKDRNDTNVFEGTHGFQLAFNQHVSALKKDDKVGIIGFGSLSVENSSLKKFVNFFLKVDEWTFSKTENVRMLVDKDLVPILKERDKKYLKKYKFGFLPKDYFGPIAINISPYEVMLSVWGNTPMVFSIKNKIVVESFWKNFEHLWKSSIKKDII